MADFPSANLTLLRNGYSDKDGTYEQFGRDWGFSREEWDEIITSRQNDLFIVKGQNQICCISSLPLRGTAITMNVILEFNSWNFERTLNAYDLIRNNGFAIVNDSNKVLLSQNIEKSEVECAGIGTDYQTLKSNGQKFSVACMKSEAVNLQYVSVIPYRDFWQKALQSLLFFGCRCNGHIASVEL